jgi:hypothetical protein
VGFGLRNSVHLSNLSHFPLSFLSFLLIDFVEAMRWFLNTKITHALLECFSPGNEESVHEQTAVILSELLAEAKIIGV